jgi:DNA replication protein DnaC
MTWFDEAVRQASAPPLVLPRRYAEAEYATIPAGPVQTAVGRYLQHFTTAAPTGIGCLFVGRARTWKTYGTAVILRRVHERLGLQCLFVQCALLASQTDRARFSDTTSQFIQQIRRAHLVVMDDFAQIPEQSPGATALMEIAESRFADQVPTLWTANIPATSANLIKHISQLYGAGFARRLYDTSEGYRVYTE